MAIKSADALGFVCITKKGDELIDETRFDYEAVFGMKVGEDGSAVISANRVEFVKWNFQRSISENMTNAVAMSRNTPIADIRVKATQKRNALLNGQIAVGNEFGMDPLERELQAFAKNWLIGRGVPTAMAITLSKKVDDATNYASKIVLEGLGASPEVLKTAWTKKAQQRVDDYKDTAIEELAAEAE